MSFQVGAKCALWGRAVLALGVVAAFSLAACTKDQPPGPARNSEEPLQITRDFETVESDSAVVRYVVRAKIARVYAGNITRAEDVQVDFFDKGKKVSVLRSREGFLDATGRMRAKGDVVVTATEGGVLETDELWWDRKLGKIRTDGPFKITEKGDVLEGVGLTTTPNLDLIETENPVGGNMREKPGLR
jgi:LPS export ABC transporter protein LptC